jgi:hypothetical protein
MVQPEACPGSTGDFCRSCLSGLLRAPLGLTGKAGTRVSRAVKKRGGLVATGLTLPSVERGQSR